MLLTVPEQFVSLLGSDDVAREQNHAGRLNTREQGSEASRHFGPVEADDEELADVLANRRLHFAAGLFAACDRGLPC